MASIPFYYTFRLKCILCLYQKIKGETFISYCEYARMVPVFHNSFNNGLTKIIRNIIKVNLFSSSLRLGTKLEKRVFKRECIISFEIMSSLSIKVIFIVDIIFSDKNGLPVFKTVLLLDISLMFRLLQYFLFAFPGYETQQFSCFLFFLSFISILFLSNSFFNMFLSLDFWKILIHKRQMIF